MPGGGGGGGEEKRHQMMQNLFGDQSEEEEEEEDVDSEHESNPQPNYASDEAEGELRHEDDGEGEGEGGGDIEGHEDVDIESEGEMHQADADPGESEGEREASSQEEDIGDQREESEGKETDSDEREEYGQRVATSRRRDVVESGSERSEEQPYPDHEDEEVDQARSPSSKSPGEEKDQIHISHSAAEIRDVFGDSDEEEEGGYVPQNDLEQDSVRSPMEEEGSYEKDLRPEDILADEDAEDGRYESEEENIEAKPKEKPLGPPLELEMPFRPPPADPTKMNIIKVSNIMGIDRKPFDPRTYVEDKNFVTDESGAGKRLRVENNIVRWKKVKRSDGIIAVESNARFVRWSDGSLQLLIGNEVLDVSVQDAHHDQTHLFLRHNKSLLQSQGRILKKMRFMPSSLSSNSHRQLSALIETRHKKVTKVQKCFTQIDPEKQKEEKEKAEHQTIRANILLNRKKEKVNRKYAPVAERRRQLSPGFLEEGLDEDDEPDYFDSRHSRRRYEEDFEAEARAERRIMNAKKQGGRDIVRKSSLPAVKSSKRPVEFSESEREESEYETEAEEEQRSPSRKRVEEPEEDYEEEEEEEEENYEEEEDNEAAEEEEAEEPRQKGKDSGGSHKRRGIESDEDSPPRKAPTHRRMAVVYDSDDE